MSFAGYLTSNVDDRVDTVPFLRFLASGLFQFWTLIYSHDVAQGVFILSVGVFLLLLEPHSPFSEFDAYDNLIFRGCVFFPLESKSL